jgi:hypothetical protein
MGQRSQRYDFFNEGGFWISAVLNTELWKRGAQNHIVDLFSTVCNRMFWKIVHVKIKCKLIQFRFWKIEIINKNTIFDELRFSRRLSRSFTFERDGHQSTEMAFLVSNNPNNHILLSNLLFFKGMCLLWQGLPD